MHGKLLECKTMAQLYSPANPLAFALGGRPRRWIIVVCRRGKQGSWYGVRLNTNLQSAGEIVCRTAERTSHQRRLSDAYHQRPCDNLYPRKSRHINQQLRAVRAPLHNVMIA